MFEKLKSKLKRHPKHPNLIVLEEDKDGWIVIEEEIFDDVLIKLSRKEWDEVKTGWKKYLDKWRKERLIQ